MNTPNVSNATVLFRPIWRVDEPDVQLFQALKPIPSEPLTRYDEQVEFDKQYLTLVISALRESLRQGEDVTVLVRLSGLVMAKKKGATEIVGIMRTLSDVERKHIVVEFANFPNNMNLGLLEDITIPLMPFCETFYACPELDRTDYTLFANINYAGVTLDLMDKPMELKFVGKLFQLFSSRASLRRLPMWVFGIAAEDIAKVARIHQVAALCGGYMQADSALPGPAITENQPFMV